MSVWTTVVSTRSFWPSSRSRATAACTTRSLIALSVSGVTVKDITLMLLARQTSPAVFADAPAPPQAQRTKNRRPEISRFTLQPARDIRGRFRINMLHVEHVMLYTYPDQAKSNGKIVRNPLISALKRISRQKLD